MAHVVESWEGHRRVKRGQAFVRKSRCADYLDGIQCQFAVSRKVEGNEYEILGYVFDEQMAHQLADLLNESTATNSRRGIGK